MPIRRQDVVDSLAACEESELRLILDAAGKSTRGAESPRQLAERVTAALWWAYCTPAAYASGQIDLDHIVNRTARRLRVRGSVVGDDAWERLASLNQVLTDQTGPVRFDSLRPDHQARARGSVFPTLAWSGGSVSSFGAGAAGRVFLRLAGTPVGRLIPWIPQVGPWFNAIKKASAVTAVVGTPLAVALAVVAANQTLSTRWKTVLPLLLSIGALGVQGRVQVAIEV